MLWAGLNQTIFIYIEHYFRKLEAPKSISWALVFRPGCQPGRKMLRLVTAQPLGLTARAATRHAPDCVNCSEMYSFLFIQRKS
jgi:hypothetical protein